MNGAYTLYTAKYNAEYIITKGKLPFGKPTEELVHDDKPMTRDEFDLYDIFKNVGYITLFMSMVHLAMAKAAKYTLLKKEKTFAKKMFKKSLFCFALFFVSYLVARREGKEMMTIIKKHVPEIAAKYGEAPAQAEDEDEEPARGRNLKAWDKYFGKTSDECKAAHGKEGECNADPACVWCACSAVPSSCFSVDDAKKLPAAVFTCDAKADDESSTGDLINQMDKQFQDQMDRFKGDDEAQDDDDEDDTEGKDFYGKHKGKKCCGMCPVMALLFLTGLYHHWQMHGYAKALEKLDQSKKAQTLANQQAPQVPPQYVQVQPVAQQQCQKKVQQAPVAFQPEVAPVNESFNYSIEDPFIDEADCRLQIDDDIPESSTGRVNSQSNGMI